MSDDKQKSGGNDRKMIALGEEYEIRDWTKSLGCTEAELREAVRAVGSSADKVKEYLSQKK